MNSPYNFYKPVVAYYGDCNPITRTEQQDIENVMLYAYKTEANYQIFTPMNKVTKNTPLSFEQKNKFLNEIFGMTFNTNQSFSDIECVIDYLNTNYSDIILFINNKSFIENVSSDKLRKCKVLILENTTPSSTMLNYVKLNQFEKFKENLPLNTNEKTAQELFDDIKEGMKIK